MRGYTNNSIWLTSDPVENGNRLYGYLRDIGYLQWKTKRNAERLRQQQQSKPKAKVKKGRKQKGVISSDLFQDGSA